MIDEENYCGDCLIDRDLDGDRWQWRITEHVILSMNFTQPGLQLLYAACMSYGNKLSDIVKNIPNEVEAVDKLSNKAKESWNLAKEIAEQLI